MKKKELFDKKYAEAFNEDGANIQEIIGIASQNKEKLRDTMDYFQKLASTQKRDVMNDVNDFDKKINALTRVESKDIEAHVQVNNMIKNYKENKRKAQEFIKFIDQRTEFLKEVLNEKLEKENHIIKSVHVNKTKQTLNYIG